MTTATDLYNAECALHNARCSHVDAWITAASDRLHDAVAAHLAGSEVHHKDGNPRNNDPANLELRVLGP